MSNLILPGRFAVDEFTEAVSKLLEPWACKGKLEGENRWGVVVLYNKKEIGMVRFTFCTHDDIEASLSMHAPTIQKETMQEMVKDILEGIEMRRAQRQQESVPTQIDTVH